FIGNINMLAGRATGHGTVDCHGLKVATTGFAAAGTAVIVALRPERVRLVAHQAFDNSHAMTIAHVVYQGETVRYLLRSDSGLELQAVELGEVRFSAGARVHAGWSADDARIIPSEGDFVPHTSGGGGAAAPPPPPPPPPTQAR